jgi:hypothetical protein
MNIKRIIREEIEGFLDSNEEDWEWVNNINPGEVQIGGFEYSDGVKIPFGLVTIGDTVTYPHARRGKGPKPTFTIEKIKYKGKIYDESNSHHIPFEARNNINVWGTNLWSSKQKRPYYDGNNINWYDGGKAVKV